MKKKPTPRRTGKPFPGKPSLGKPFPGKPSLGKPFPGKPSLGKPFPGKPFPGKPSLSKPFPGKPSLGKPFPGKPSLGKAFPGKPSLGKAFPGKPFPGKPSLGKEGLEKSFSTKHPSAPLSETSLPPQRRRVEPALDFDSVIYGRNSVEEALRAGEPMKRLYVGRDREQDPVLRDLIGTARAAKIPVIFEEQRFFARFPYKAHQDIVAIGEPFGYIGLDDAIGLRRSNRLIVLLDHLTDPHNVGAILRTAECAGAQALLLPDRRSAGINATVRKGAAGAASHLPVARVGNLSAAIRALKAADFTVIGASLEDRAIALTEAPLGEDIALVIGAEGDGLSRLVAKNCDQLVKIPLLGKVASLNASVAAGVILYEIVRRRQAT